MRFNCSNLVSPSNPYSQLESYIKESCQSLWNFIEWNIMHPDRFPITIALYQNTSTNLSKWLAFTADYNVLCGLCDCTLVISEYRYETLHYCYINIFWRVISEFNLYDFIWKFSFLHFAVLNKKYVSVFKSIGDDILRVATDAIYTGIVFRNITVYKSTFNLEKCMLHFLLALENSARPFSWITYVCICKMCTVPNVSITIVK